MRATARRVHPLATRIAPYTVDLLVIALPMTVFVPLTPPAASGIYPMYVGAGIDLVEVTALLVVIAAGLAERRPLLPLSADFMPPLLVIGACALAVSPFALHPALAVYTAARWLLAAALYWALSRLRPSAERVATLLLVTLAVHVLVGIGQVMRQAPLGLPGELALERMQSGAAVLMGEIRWLRPYGLTFHPNVLGGFLAVGLLLGLLLIDRLATRLLWWLSWLGVLLTFSRSAWLALLASLPPAALWSYQHRPAARRALGMTLCGAVVIALAAGWALRAQLDARFWMPPSPPASSGLPVGWVRNDAISHRLEMLDLAARTMVAQPLTGVGPGNFPLLMQAAGSAAPPQYVHNVPLLLGAEIGCVGLVAWLWLCGIGARVAVRHCHILPAASAVALAAWLALSLIALVDSYPWGLSSGRLLTITVLALAAGGTPEGRAGAPGTAA